MSLMESRKRPLVDSEGPVAKKRILTGANGSPHVNGDSAEPDDEAFGEKLETFRKEAIYRRMKHYCREHERSKARIQELEQRKSTCEAGLAAISACWAQLVDTIRLVVKPEDHSPISLRAKEIFDLAAHAQTEPSEGFNAALADTVNATQALVTKFVQLEEGSRYSVLQSQSFAECQKAHNECAMLRSELSMLRARLQDSETRQENYYNALVVAENRVERLQSATVREMESREPAKKIKQQENEKEEKEEVTRKPPSPVPVVISASPPPHTNGTRDTVELDALVEQVRNRELRIVELEKEAALLKEEKDGMELEHKAPSFDQISENQYYKLLLHHASHLEHLLETKDTQIATLRDDYASLQRNHRESEENLTNTTAQTVQDYRAMISKRDAENARLREQREQQSAELNERRSKDAVKHASLQEYKTLLDTNSERISILQSELRRCKAQLAATANAEELMLFFLAGNVDEVKYFEELKERNTQAENRVAALEQTFSVYQDEHPDIVMHMKLQADALAQLASAKSELEKYQRIYGPSATLSPDASQLAEQLRVKETELEKLRLLETQRKESEASLFSELEKLSALWESLDRQLKGKVLDLANLEDRLSKSGIDKAKSDNKYYAAMRDKEAIENERKNLARTLEKQGKVVDRLTDCEKQLRSQMIATEKENTGLKKINDTLGHRILRLEKEVPELQAQLEGEKKRNQEFARQSNHRDAAKLAEASAFRSKEDEWMQRKKDLEKEVAQLKKRRKLEPSHISKADPESDKLANLEALINCSTCRETNAFRSTIITKCMHTFCKSCIDSRLATRQRKCPACNLAFGQSDVHQFFFQ